MTLDASVAAVVASTCLGMEGILPFPFPPFLPFCSTSDLACLALAVSDPGGTEDCLFLLPFPDAFAEVDVWLASICEGGKSILRSVPGMCGTSSQSRILSFATRGVLSSWTFCPLAFRCL